MSDQAADTAAEQPVAPSRSFGSILREMPRWKKIAVGTALCLVVVGGVMSLMTSGTAPATGSGGTDSASGLRSSLIEGQPGSGGTATGTAAEEPASKGIFRLGFSFLAGFCIGIFLRATLKIAAIAIGFWLVMTFVLSYVGLVNVDWTAMDALWNRFVGSIEQEWGSFQTFMLGSLPATGLAATGLVVGLKRN